MSSPTPAAASGPDTCEVVDGRTTRWDAHRTKRRADLVAATLRAIRRHGAGVGMDDIAASAGTSKTVFYRHFGDRAGLYRAVAHSVDARIIAGVTGVLSEQARPGTESGPEALTSSSESARAQRLMRAAVVAYLELVEVDPEVYRFIVAAPLVPPKERSSADPAAVTDVMSSRMAGLLADQLVAAGRDPEQAAIWGQAIVGMVRSVADQWLRSGASASGTHRSQLATDVSTLIWGGLASTWD